MNPNVLFAVAIDALTVLVCLFAWWKGGPAERWGGTINLVSGAVSVLARIMLHVAVRDVTLLVADGFLAFGLLFLGVRYASLWIGAAMLLQAVQFLLHTYYFVMEIHHDALFAMVNNLVSMGILICILSGALLTLRKRAAAAVGVVAS